MFVERAFVINLPFCEERIQAFTKTVSALTTLPSIETWPAIHGDTCLPPSSWLAGAGAWGCYRSHLGILEYCLNNRVGSYIVFEDDAQFRPNFDSNFEQFVEAIPDDWEQAYLGGQLLHTNTHPTIKINQEVYRPYNINRTHAFMVSRTGMLSIYQHLCDLPFHPREHIDHHLGRWHEDQRNKVYVPKHWLVGQNGFASNVSGRTEEIKFYEDPYTTCQEHRLYDDPICIVFRGSRDLLLQSRKLLHAGNQIDKHGIDVTLTLAAKLLDPIPEIDKWYGWIRSEIIYNKSNALPCLYQPRITNEMLNGCSFRAIEVHPKTYEDIELIHASLQP